MDDLKTYVETLVHDEMKSYKNLACCVFECSYDDQLTLFKTVRRWGGEGEGNNRGIVIKVEVDGGDRYLHVSWPYDSWEGDYFEDAEYREVFPREKTVTVFNDSYCNELFTGIPT